MLSLKENIKESITRVSVLRVKNFPSLNKIPLLAAVQTADEADDDNDAQRR